MAELERRVLHHYNGRALNYLNEWAQRTGNTERIDQYEVRTQFEPATGITWGIIVTLGDPVAKTTSQSYDLNAGESAAPEAETPKGKRKPKAAVKSADPFE